MKKHTRDVLDECAAKLAEFGYIKRRRGQVFKKVDSDIRGYILLQPREVPGGLVVLDVILAVEWGAVSLLLRKGFGSKKVDGIEFLKGKFLYSDRMFGFQDGIDHSETMGELISFAVREADKRFPEMMDKDAIRESVLGDLSLGAGNPQRLIAIDWEIGGREAAERTFLSLLASDLTDLIKEQIRDFWASLSRS